MSKLISLIV